MSRRSRHHREATAGGSGLSEASAARRADAPVLRPGQCRFAGRAIRARAGARLLGKARLGAGGGGVPAARRRGHCARRGASIHPAERGVLGRTLRAGAGGPRASPRREPGHRRRGAGTRRGLDLVVAAMVGPGWGDSRNRPAPRQPGACPSRDAGPAPRRRSSPRGHPGRAPGDRPACGLHGLVAALRDARLDGVRFAPAPYTTWSRAPGCRRDLQAPGTRGEA